MWTFLSLRLGFLGLLHMEVFNQRLEQEYNASVIVTAPTVPYKAVLSSAKLIKVRAPSCSYVSLFYSYVWQTLITTEAFYLPENRWIH